ncbi:MAG: MarR family transcriptional regulator [Promethearchaeota archaeon]
MSESDESIKKWREQIKKRRGIVPDSLRESNREGNQIKRKIRKSLNEGDKTIPEISKEIEVPSEKVHWFITSMRKYGEIKETTKRKGSYYTYALIDK